MVAKCASARERNRRVDLGAESIVAFIPVTTPHYVTYANVYCALCNGQNRYEFWNAEITDFSRCLVEMLMESLNNKTTPNIRGNSACRQMGVIAPIPNEKLKLWMRRQAGKSSSSRHSMFCFANRAFNCNFGERKGVVEANSNACYKGRRYQYQICHDANAKYASMFFCDDCTGVIPGQIYASKITNPIFT